MIASRSRIWWHQFSVAGVLVALASCSSNAYTPEPTEEVEPGAISGELAVYIADYDDGTTETRYMLKNAAGEETRLHFSMEPTIAPGSHIHVWGGPTSDGIRVEQYKVAARPTGDIESQAQPKINPTPRAPRDVCPALVQISGGTGTITIDQIEQQFHVGPKSVNAFYIENSYGKDSVVGATYGPLDYTAAAGCDTNGLTKALKPMIQAQDPNCKQFSWVMVPKVSGCAWSGLASVGSPTSPAQDTWYNASIGCVVTVQEPGHNYGMNHSSSMTCSNAAFFSDDLTTCTHSEYGDKFDPMGGGCRHMNGYQKWYQTWLEGCNGVKTGASGTFNLMPMETACNGLQTLELTVPGAKTRLFNRPAGGGGSAGMDTLTSYYLEYRTSQGLFDTGMTPQVLVHVGPDATVTSKGGGPHMWLVDASVGAKAGALGANPGMVAGGTFSDPAGGLTVTVMSMDATKAVIQVDYTAGTGGATCVDGSAFTPPGDETCAGTVSDAGPPPPQPEGGGGKGGTAGAAGAGGKAGAAGAGGSAGKGGAGAGGAAGTSGAAGAAGTAGTGGVAGAGGSGATGGSAGGDTGGTTGGRTPTGGGGNTGGCGCRIASPTSEGKLAGLLALGLGTVFASRRRRRR
jgi:MYXO-CTERM domain-containing protein